MASALEAGVFTPHSPRASAPNPVPCTKARLSCALRRAGLSSFSLGLVAAHTPPHGCGRPQAQPALSWATTLHSPPICQKQGTATVGVSSTPRHSFREGSLEEVGVWPFCSKMLIVGGESPTQLPIIATMLCWPHPTRKASEHPRYRVSSHDFRNESFLTLCRQADMLRESKECAQATQHKGVHTDSKAKL